MMDSNQDNLVLSNTDRIGRGYFAKAGLTFDLGNDRLLLNYDIYYNNNDNTTNSNGLTIIPNPENNAFLENPFTSLDAARTNMIRQEAVITYQKRFSDKNKKLDFEAGYTRSDNDFLQDNIFNQSLYGGLINLGTILDNTSLMEISNFKVDYSQPAKILDEGKISLGGLFEKQSFNTQSFGTTNLEYNRYTTATYLEISAKLKKFDFKIGTRAENYDISGTTRYFEDDVFQEKSLIPFNKFKLFPNASVQYNILDQLYFALNYDKKISLPTISALNPNNNTFQGPNTTITGNPFLQPTIYNNFEAKLSAFDYAFISFNVSTVDNQIAQLVYREENLIRNQQINIPDMKIHNFNFGMPLPFMVFYKPLSEIMEMNFNIDKMNFLYFYFGKHPCPINNKLLIFKISTN